MHHIFMLQSIPVPDNNFPSVKSCEQMIKHSQLKLKVGIACCGCKIGLRARLQYPRLYDPMELVCRWVTHTEDERDPMLYRGFVLLSL